MENFSEKDSQFMALAIQQARRGIYTTRPNPNVGCVIVKEGQLLSSGFHLQAGLGHAEVNALQSLQQSHSAEQTAQLLRGATVYVTLEPCSHQGRTGSCARALIKAKVARVVCAMSDPNPLVAGSGFRLLREAGIEVAVGLMAEQAQASNLGFCQRMTEQMPRVNIKLAMSLDGRTAMQSGESQWITGPAARSDVQRLRARSCAIITGIGSIEHDDSSLTVRPEQLGLELSEYNLEMIAAQQPLRVVVDSQNRLSKNAKILVQSGRTLRVIAVPLAAEDNENVVSLPADDGQVDLKALLRYLAVQEHCNNVLVEAGATLAGSFVSQGLFDQLTVYMAPTILGASARPLLALKMDKMSQQQRLELVDQRFVGEDIRLSYQKVEKPMQPVENS
ncbi:riboflavin biosynthesis protein RibD ['Osedax' symbiont bacterium Rs2_46_30_T18]|nr:riboflavin biosynthesis protein RibD ['Osedax' symbiont bacterium Rs2_46_30_T18]